MELMKTLFWTLSDICPFKARVDLLTSTIRCLHVIYSSDSHLSVAPAGLLAASMVAEPLTHIGFQVMVEVETLLTNNFLL